MNNTKNVTKIDLSHKYVFSAKVLSVLVFIFMWTFKFVTRSQVTQVKEAYDNNITYILASNHISIIDPFLITPAGGFKAFKNIPYRFMAYNGFLNKWYLKWFMLPLGCFPSHLHSKYLHGIEAGRAMVASKQTVVIFPQGKRTTDMTAEAKYGVEDLSHHDDVRVIPVLLTRAGKIRYKIQVGRSFNAQQLKAQEIMNKIYNLKST